MGAGPGAAGAPVSHLERAGIWLTDEALLDLAAGVLGQGKTSRLYKRLVYKDQIATSATSTNDTNEIGGQFDFTLTANPVEI